MLRLTVSLGVVLGFATVTGGVYSAAPCLAGPEQSADLVAEWESRYEKSLKDAANEYGKIVKKYADKLEATSAYTRRRMLRYLPDDEENRKFLGYLKEKLNDGTENWKWVRNDVRRDQLNEMSDLDDPKATKYGKDLTDADKKVAGWFKGLAKKATENGAAKDASADAKWSEKATRAWERVLEVDDVPTNKDAEEAHKALNHPKFEGKYVTPLKQQYVKARAERKKSGEKTGASAPKADAVECDGSFVSSGLAGGGAKSPHVTFNTSHGKEAAITFVQAAEKALSDLVEIYAFPEQIKDRLGVSKINFIKDTDEFRKLMTKGFNWKDAKVQQYIDAHFGGTGENGEWVHTCSAGADGADASMNITAMLATRAAQGAARADLGSSVRDEVEDWLWQSIGYDVTKRVNGTCILKWGGFGRYGDTIEARPGEDKWVELARRLVQTDDDVPLQKFPKFKINEQDFKGPQIVKGWAFLQFVFEKDPAKAKTFLWNALANGTPQAVALVYPDNEDSPDPEKSMEKLDAEYRQWILKAW